MVFLAVVFIFVFAAGSFAKDQKPAKRKGPIDTDYNKAGFRITKVMRIEKEENALGKLLERDAKFEVGRAPEMTKKLDEKHRGEEYLVRWEYSGKKVYSKVEMQFEFKLKNRADVLVLSKEYENLRPGGYKVLVKNVGSSFSRGGEIEYWKATVVADKQVVAEKKSFLWDAFSQTRKAKEKSETSKES